MRLVKCISRRQKSSIVDYFLIHNEFQNFEFFKKTDKKKQTIHDDNVSFNMQIFPPKSSHFIFKRVQESILI